MKPFNLERALAGDPVVTRGGIKVIQLHLFEKGEILRPLFVLLEGKSLIISFFKDGSYDDHIRETIYDLMMAPKTKKYRVNIFKENSGTLRAGGVHLIEYAETLKSYGNPVHALEFELEE